MKRIQMSNKKYGALTVLEFVENGNNGARWKCKCDCGKIKIIDGYLLRRGSVKTCGCRIGINYNFVGKRFGKLRITEKLGSYKDRSLIWKAVCDCGNTIEMKSRSLLYGNVKSCGCLRKIKKGEANLRKIYRGYKNEAKIKNILFNLSIEEFKKITSKKCFYCGIEPKQRSYRKFSNGIYLYNGIDRRNNLLGYTKENSLPCCFICNRAKGNMSYENFILWIKKIAKR